TLSGLAAAAGSAPLHSTVGQNGVFGDAAGTFPTQSFQSSNYFVDVVAQDDGLFPGVTSTTPDSGSTTASPAANVSATFDVSLNPSTVNTSTLTLRDSGGNLVPASVNYDDATHTATLDPTGSLVASSSYTARLEGSITGTNGNVMGSPYVWTFTTANTGPPSIVSRN